MSLWHQRLSSLLLALTLLVAPLGTSARAHEINARPFAASSTSAATPTATPTAGAATTLGPTGPVGDPDLGTTDNLSASPVTTGPGGGVLAPGDQIALALYADSGGSPGALVVGSAPQAPGAAGCVKRREK